MLVSNTVSADSDSRGLSRSDPTSVAVDAAANPLTQGSNRALIIGNNEYLDPQKVWVPLKTAVSDASTLAELLKTEYQFTDITLLKNATRKQIFRAIAELTDKANAHDSVLVYYAGHGWRNEKTKEAYWIPVDAEGEDDSTYISNVRIKEKLSIIADKAAHTLLISDSCFSGSLLDSRGNHSQVKNDNSLDYFQKVAIRKSVQILAAGGKEFVDDNYRNSSHSPFTYFLINELRLNSDPYLTLGSLAMNIEQLVANNSLQTPQSGAFRQAGDEGGQFIFAKVNIEKLDKGLKRLPDTSDIKANNELEDWKKVDTANVQHVKSFIEKYPNGSIADLARLKVKELYLQMDHLIALASSDIGEGRFALPPGKNALERYQKVLNLDPDNVEVKSLLEKLFDSASNQVRLKIGMNDLHSANEFLMHLERIQPNTEAHAAVIQNLRNELVAKQTNQVSKNKETESDKKTDAAETPPPKKKFVPSFNF